MKRRNLGTMNQAQGAQDLKLEFSLVILSNLTNRICNIKRELSNRLSKVCEHWICNNAQRDQLQVFCSLQTKLTDKIDRIDVTLY